ncbi:DUF3024 domain-containing protein [Vibrio sp. WZ-1]|uniref:DUF3024 domain-containing protein n=1 Tax=Vibrio sp. WZ-1 TaxID=3454501 RepID=UPI003F854A23
MSVSRLAMSRLNKAIQTFCSKRNASLPVELGKSLYEPIDNGVELYHAHYLLDSQHSEYTSSIARILFHEGTQTWLFFVPSEEEKEGSEWVPYSSLPRCKELEDLIAELETDPQACFWQ